MTSLPLIGLSAARLAAIALCVGCGARSELDGAATTSGACPPSPTPRVLFTADYLADELTGDGNRVYALSVQETPGYSTDLIESIDPCTGDAVSLGDATPFDADDPAVVASGGSVYWVSMGAPPGPAQTLQRAAAAGGTATTVLQTGEQVEALAVAAGTFFGIGFEGENLALFSLPLAGGARTALASDAYYVDPIVEGSIVYYAGSDSGIGRVTTTGEAMPALPPAEQAFCGNGGSTLRSMAADADALYTFTREAFNLWRVPKDGSTPTLLTTSTSCSQIVVDDAYVYFSSPGDGGGILRVPKAGGAVETVAPETEPGNIVVDANSVYWVHAGTAVMKIDK